MSESTPLLAGQGISKRYGGVIAVDGVDIEVSAGEILGLVGPNGAGKTTLVDVISGVQQMDAGTLTLLGRPLTGSSSRRARAGLARTFQHPQLALSLTIAENLEVGRTARRFPGFFKMLGRSVTGVLDIEPAADLEAVERIADELGITGLDRRADRLTLGEQRLVEVGRALCQDPDVLLLDEPFAGSDADSLAGIADVIRAAARPRPRHHPRRPQRRPRRLARRPHDAARERTGRRSSARPRRASPATRCVGSTSAPPSTRRRPSRTRPPRPASGWWSPMHSLDIEQLTVHYGRAVAVDGVSVKVPGGAVTCLVGPERGRQEQHHPRRLRRGEGERLGRARR